MHWRVIHTSGDKPGYRICHTLTTVHSNQIVLFGGWEGDEQRYNDIHIFNTETNFWTRCEGTGDIPDSRSTHSLTAINEGRQLLLFGGYKAEEVRLNDIHILEIDSMNWIKVEMAGPVPPPRNTHSATLLADGQRVFIFGGRDQYTFFNDCWVLNISNMRWTELHPSGPKPSGRSGHTGVLVRGNCVMIFGGWSGQHGRHDDLWEFNVDTQVWKEHHPIGEKPSQRSGHTSCLISPDVMMVFGGWSVHSFRNDVHLLDLNTLVWRQVYPQGKTPNARRFHGMTAASNAIYLFGGRDNQTQYKDMICLEVGPKPLADLCCLIVNSHRQLYQGVLDSLPLVLQQRVYSSSEEHEKEEQESEEHEEEDEEAEEDESQDEDMSLDEDEESDDSAQEEAI